MSLAITYSRACSGINAPLVTVETHISNGLPRISIVGLAETAVKESKERVRSALLNCHFSFPTRRITVNLAPADLPKEGGIFDLAIAVSILVASGQLVIENIGNYEFVGELALNGELRAIKGVLPLTIATGYAKRILFVPYENRIEAAVAKDVCIYPAKHLLQVCAHLCKEKLITRQSHTQYQADKFKLDYADVHGQDHAKRAIEIAAAGRHHLLMVGPPGTGKTLLASRFATILPRLTQKQALEIASIASISPHSFRVKEWMQRPFRAPHHSASSVALVGGGSSPRPGEISLAHHGVLFLDELPEFNRQVLEVLREPLESGRVMISRAGYQAEFPACFQLIAAMNPCRCGDYGDPDGNCRCTEDQVLRYQFKISKPLLDRIDLHIEVPRQRKFLFAGGRSQNVPSCDIRKRVEFARNKQIVRAQKLNADLSSLEVEKHCQLSRSSQLLLARAMKKFKLSMRACHRIIKVTRTIADLDDEETISDKHIAEALTYRCKLLDSRPN